MIYVTGEVYSATDTERKLRELLRGTGERLPYTQYAEWLGDQMHLYDEREVLNDHDSVALFLDFRYDEEASEEADMDLYTWDYSTSVYRHETGDFGPETFYDNVVDAIQSYNALEKEIWK